MSSGSPRLIANSIASGSDVRCEPKTRVSYHSHHPIPHKLLITPLTHQIHLLPPKVSKPTVHIDKHTHIYIHTHILTFKKREIEVWNEKRKEEACVFVFQFEGESKKERGERDKRNLRGVRESSREFRRSERKRSFCVGVRKGRSKIVQLYNYKQFTSRFSFCKKISNN